MEISADKTFGTCEYCGSTMTLPKIDDDVRAAAFNRGNHFRRAGEFDKALQVYEKIVEEDPNDAEAHWCCALCRFGIEWVEDPGTMEYLPTCHRVSFDPFTEDVDCKAAIELSDGITKRQYQKDAARIAEVQKGILAASQNEKPFDVFICYKESDEKGNRTVDSTLAQDIYYQLTDEGLRVFFARITLEDKTGSEYEPYIFAALNSAKVMVVVGTKPEHFNAVWVKNEWARFLSIVKRDRKKVILPCYRDMDPYDLPEQLSILQSYDMSKIGFMQDLIRGIKKIAKSDEPKTAVKETVVIGGNSNVAPLLKRAFMFLEDGNWEEADSYCEKVLDQDPENAQAYLGKLMADLHVHRQEDLPNCERPFNGNSNFQKAVRFGGEKVSSVLNGYIAHINERNENARLTGIYKGAVNAMNAANTEAAYKTAAETFKTIPGFKDADSLAEQCLDKAEQAKRKAFAVAHALKEGVKSKSSPTLEERLAAAKTKVGYLERILNVFDATQSQIQAFQIEFNAAISREKQLADQRSRLGVFAGKEKKRIDEELASASKKKSELAARIEQNQKTLGKYSSVTDVEHDLQEARSSVNDVEAQIESAQKNADNEYSFKEALNIYLNQTDVAAAVNAIYPAANTIKFGKYVQKKNGLPEPIEWLVLKVAGDKVLVISKYALDCQQYNSSLTKVTWETCSLRKWLNGTFINNAFSSDEQNMIQSTTVTADKNPMYSTSPGNNTTDKVFLLSIPEVNKYFGSNETRMCEPTEYAKAQGAYTNSNYSIGGKATCWWLRSPGRHSDWAASVRDDDFVRYISYCVDFSIVAVRPALWLNLGS